MKSRTSRALSCVFQVPAGYQLRAASNRVMHLSVEPICCVNANHPVRTKAQCRRDVSLHPVFVLFDLLEQHLLKLHSDQFLSRHGGGRLIRADGF